MVKKAALALFFMMSILGSSLCVALVSVSNTGTWPESWPKELEPFHNQAKTYDVAHGIQETVHEIPFDSQEYFEIAWPHILTLKSAGGVLILEKSPSTYSISGSTADAGVRILCPSGGASKTPDGKQLTAGPPWPESVMTKSGELSEYVVIEEGKWVPADRSKFTGFLHRARVDIVLITDGKIVDLNRIPLPPDTPIIDNRFIDKSKP